MLDFVFAVVNDKICGSDAGMLLGKGYEDVMPNFDGVTAI